MINPLIHAQWEYKRSIRPLLETNDKFLIWLNQNGLAGWELITFQELDDSRICIFKRHCRHYASLPPPKQSKVAKAYDTNDID